MDGIGHLPVLFEVPDKPLPSFMHSLKLARSTTITVLTKLWSSWPLRSRSCKRITALTQSALGMGVAGRP
jgi:hypothetical protein